MSEPQAQTEDDQALAAECPIDECEKCHAEKDWKDCYNCEDGYSDHDCGEDCCCCLNPEPNVICDICEGHGGWYVCLNCNPGALDD